MSDVAVVSDDVPTVEPVVESPKAVDKYPLNHKGFGRYEMNGVTYPSKDEAVRARADLIARDEIEEEFGDIAPEGFDFKVTDRSLVFRGSVLEVPMNELYLPDGSYNPMYDRAWYYAWAARRARSISSYESLGYVKVTNEELEAMVEEGKAPAHYLSLLQRDGDWLVHGDLLLMRTPRIRWRQRKLAEEENMKRRIENRSKNVDRESDRFGLPRESVGLN